jgi:hypothetical protein
MKNKFTAIIAGTMLVATTAVLPALAAEPSELTKHGFYVFYPSLTLKPTKLCIQSLNNEHWASVRVNAGRLHTEEVGVGGQGAIRCIERRWGGIDVKVSNSRVDLEIPVKVWTNSNRYSGDNSSGF